MEIPPGWKVATIGSAIEIKVGRKVPPVPKSDLIEELEEAPSISFPVYGSSGLIGESPDSLTNAPCLVLGRRGTVGAVHLVNDPCWISSTALYTDDFESHDLHYWYYLLQSLELHKLAKGTTVLRIDTKEVAQEKVLLPPKAKQQELAAVIENNLGKLAKVKTALQGLRKILQELRSSLLVSSISEDWESVELGELVEAVEMGDRNLDVEEEPVTEAGGVGIAKVGIITNQGLDFTKTQTLKDPSRVNLGKLIKPGDFLISIGNTLKKIGMCAIAGEVSYQVMISSKLVRLTLSPKVNKEYLCYYLQSKWGRWELESRTIGVQALRHLSKATLLKVKVLLPPLEQQEEISRSLSTSLRLYNQIETGVTQTEQDLELLQRTMLEQIFPKVN